MIKRKKSQLLILSGTFLILLILSIYALETGNVQKPIFNQNALPNNIKYESCKIGYLSNGTFIDGRFGNFSQDISSYCTNLGYSCNLTITKDGGAPSNLSLLNYTHYNYNIYYLEDTIIVNQSFNC